MMSECIFLFSDIGGRGSVRVSVGVVLCHVMAKVGWARGYV